MWAHQGWSLQWGCPVCCGGGCAWGSCGALQGHSSVERPQSSLTPRSPLHPAGRSSLDLQHRGRTHLDGHWAHPGWTEKNRRLMSSWTAKESNLKTIILTATVKYIFFLHLFKGTNMTFLLTSPLKCIYPMTLITQFRNVIYERLKEFLWEYFFQDLNGTGVFLWQ